MKTLTPRMMMRVRSVPEIKLIGWGFLPNGMAVPWTYAPSMPLVFGVGASPLLQWLLVPGALAFLLKRSGPS